MLKRYFVIFFMSSDKSNIYPFDCKLDDYDKTMVLPTNVEHIMLIADIIDTVETLFYVRKTLLLCLLYHFHPILQSCLSVRESGDVIF